MGILLESKRKLVELAHLSLRPALYANKFIRSVRFAYIDTDCVHIYIKAQSYESSKHVLTLSEIFFQLHDILDLSKYCPRPGKPKRVFDELKRARPDMTENMIVEVLCQNAKKAGVLSLECPLQDSYLCIPYSVCILKEKLYYINCIYYESEDSAPAFVGKSAARGAIPRARASKFTLDDFVRMSTAQKTEFASRLFGIRTRNLGLYQVEMSRRFATRFSPKRFLLPNGGSLPFGHHRCDELEHESEDAPLDL